MEHAIVIEEPKVPQIFISGPMSGKPDYNLAAFDEAEKYLINLGYNPYNPAHNGRAALSKYGDIKKKSKEYFELLDACKRQLFNCQGIYLLKGWENSYGARQELSIALDLSLMIMLEQ